MYGDQVVARKRRSPIALAASDNDGLVRFVVADIRRAISVWLESSRMKFGCGLAMPLAGGLTE
jgi:hypothetical protein